MHGKLSRRIASFVAAVLCLAGTAACDHFEPSEPQLDPIRLSRGPDCSPADQGLGR